MGFFHSVIPFSLAYPKHATNSHVSAHRYEEAKEKSTVDYCYALYHLDQAILSIPASVNMHKAGKRYAGLC